MFARYLLRQTLLPLVLALVLLVAVVFALQALRLGHHLVGAGGGVLLLATVLAHALPTLLVFGLPLALVAALLFTAARLAPELEAMQGAGASPARLSWGLLLLALLASVSTFAGARYAEPLAARRLHDLLRAEAGRALLSALEPGLFQRIGGATLFVEQRTATRPGELLRGRGLLLAHGDQLVLARDAGLTLAAGPVLSLDLREGELQRLDARTHTLYRLRFARLRHDVALGAPFARHFGFLARRAAEAPRRALQRALGCLAIATAAIALLLLGRGRRRFLVAAAVLAIAHEGLAAILPQAASYAIDTSLLLAGAFALGVTETKRKGPRAIARGPLAGSGPGTGRS